MTPSDPDLIARALASDDRAAFGELVRRHQSSVRRFLRHLSGDAALADDLAQETFVEAWRGLARFNGGAPFSTWLLGIAHNRWRNARRSLARSPLCRDESGCEPATAPPSDLRRDIGEALTRLSEEERTAIHLCYHQGLTHAEAADVLKWPIGTVKTHIARSKEQLRHLLAAWNPRT